MVRAFEDEIFFLSSFELRRHMILLIFSVRFQFNNFNFNYSQRRPMLAHEDEKGPKWRCVVWATIRYVFFNVQFISYFLTNHTGPRRPTVGNDGQWRPTQVNKSVPFIFYKDGEGCVGQVTKTGPNDASGVVWAICNNVWFFLVFFFDTNLLFDVYIGSIYILQGRGGLCWAAVTKTGHRFSFFFFFHTNLLFDGYIGSIDVLKGPGGLRWVAVTKTGPNDASGVVWAICNNVWFFLVFFLILTYFLMSI